jgi:hypothetical protein
MTKPTRTVTREAFVEARLYMNMDIRRMIAFAKAAADPEKRKHLEAAGIEAAEGGSLLATLGLLCYTEFGGWLKFRASTARKNFESFFATLGNGTEYKDFAGKHEVYRDFRCGTAHVYFIKNPNVTTHMTGSTVYSFDGGHSMGIGHDATNNHYWFVVETYHRHLADAFERLENELTFPLNR